MKDVLVALIASGIPYILLYAALDHWEPIQTRPRLKYWLTRALFVLIILGFGFQYWTTKKDQQKASDDAAATATAHRAELDLVKDQLQKTREENVQLAKESQDKVQQALTELAKARSEAQIRELQSELSDWASSSFLTNRQESAAKYLKLRDTVNAENERIAQENEKRVHAQFSQAYAPAYFAIHFIQESVRAYAKKVGEDIKIDNIDLPQDLWVFDQTAEIRFPSGAIWSLHAYRGGDALWINIDFMDANKVSVGRSTTAIDPSKHNIDFDYFANPSIPDRSTISGGVDILAYEIPMKRKYQAILSIQLLLTSPK